MTTTPKRAELPVTYKPVSELLDQRNPRNPRVIAPERRQALKHGLRRFGLVEALVWNKRTSRLVSGHQRLELLHEQGYDEVPVVEVDLDDDEELALNVLLNNPGAQGDFTPEVLEIVAQVRAADLALYDELRLFEATALAVEGEEEKQAEAEEDATKVPDMELQPFEHYDYVFLVCNDVRDWNWLSTEFLKLRKVNASPVGRQKVGLMRGVWFRDFKKALEAEVERRVQERLAPPSGVSP